MRVLVGPVIKNQGLKEDFCYTNRGEVLFSWDCPCNNEDCTRHTFSGTDTHKGSAFAEVAERPDLTPTSLRRLYTKYLKDSGLASYFSEEEVRTMANEEVALCSTLSFLSPGEIVARTPDGVYVPDQFRESGKILAFRGRNVA